MTFQLLKTKLEIPIRQKNVLSRKRLRKFLDGVYDFRAVLVSAPAGYGKTVVISDWAQPRRKEVAWISLDEGDNDPIRFFSYLKEAVKSLGHTVDEVDGFLSSYPVKPIETTLVLLINSMLDIGKPVVLVLDDYHRVTNPEVHKILEFLLERLPRDIHLIISTRTDPPIALDRFRIRNWITEIRQDHLCFNQEEVKLLLNNINELRLSENEIVRLAEKTEGWIAGLHIAALVLKNDKYSNEFINRFSGNHSFIMDFLVKEAYFSQPEEIRQFLLESSVLDDLCGDLCNTVTLRENSQALLDKLVADNLFIVNLDDQKQWHRYHHLFSDVLRNLLQRTIPHHIRKLCYRASEWYQQNGLLDEAVRYAFKAEDKARAADLIEAYALTAISQGERSTIRNWLEKLPETAICERPVLCLLQAWVIMNDKTAVADELFTLRLQTAEEVIMQKDAGTCDTDSGPFASTNLLRMVSFLRAIFAFERENPSVTFLDDLQKSLDGMKLSENELSVAMLYLMGHVQLRTMDYHAAYRSFADCISVAKIKGNHYFIAYATYLQGWILFQKGKYQQTLDLCEKTLKALPQVGNDKMRRFPLMVALNVITGAVHLEQNQVNKAHSKIVPALKILQKSTEVGIVTNGIYRLILALLAQSDVKYNELNAAINDLEAMGQYHKSILPLAEMLRNISSSREGCIPSVPDDADKLKKSLLIDTERFKQELLYYQDYEWQLMQHLIMIRLHLNRLARMKLRPEQKLFLIFVNYLEFHANKTEKLELTRLRIEILITMGIVYDAYKKTETAVATLMTALGLAFPENALRAFVDNRDVLAGLLSGISKRGNYSEFIDLILMHESTDSDLRPANKKNDRQIADAESLSGRELEVLRLIAVGHSNQEISSKLFISLNTVKSHITSIYNKLGVRKRTRAVSKANQIGLL